ncbi:MAG: nucleoside-diphosphate sugar epimerase/dehydratase [Gammaproteobacteria bacterium]
MNFKNRLLSSSRRTKQILVASTDFISFSFASLLALFLSNLDVMSLTSLELLRVFWIPFISVFIFYLFGIYRSVLRFIDFTLIHLLFKAVITAFLVNLILRFFYINYLDSFLALNEFNSLISSVGWVAGFLCSLVLVVASRVYANFLLSSKSAEKKVVIYGAGSAGIQLSEALKVSSEMQPIAFFDSDPLLENTFLGGLKILNPSKLQKFTKRNGINEVLIAMPSASKSTLSNLLKEIEGLAIKVRILPGLAALAQGKVSLSELKEVDISDLLGRQEVEANKDLLTRNITNKNVLITGAGGSIGSEISRQVTKNNPKKVILLDSNEYALYSIKNEIEGISTNAEIFSILGNVTNKKRMLDVLNTFNIDTVYHTAAYKHVPLVEENPFEAVFNNIIGTKISAESALEASVETFVLISTDKAVRPTNIMGATKRFAELLLQSMSKGGKTKMSMVRFGNVMGSSGSAVPLFQQQIKEGGPVTVTHPEVTRYFMSIPEAAELVIQAGAMGQGGDVFVLDMGEPVKIVDLAKRLISLSGKEIIDDYNQDGDIEIKFTGLRPGEKLYEELLIGDNVSTTEHPRILKAKEDNLAKEELHDCLGNIERAEQDGHVDLLKESLKEVVVGFSPDKANADIIYLKKNSK